jgi:predicted nucleotidyltransferase
MISLPGSVPQPHRDFIARTQALQKDDRIVGVAAGGSLLMNEMDEYSDLDLVVAIEPVQYADVLADRRSIAASLGQLLAAFTGEHVGESRLLICLYAEPLLHVDFKFVSLHDFGRRVEDPAIVWQRSARLTDALQGSGAKFPTPDPQWIEDRFWVWVHNAATKIGRGELFETLDALSFLRATVLGPLALQREGARPSGVRRLETVTPEFARDLRRTIAGYDALECLRALRASVELYRELRPGGATAQSVSALELAAMDYLAVIERRRGSIGA